MNASAWWIVAGLALVALEMLAPGVFLLWIGLAAVVTGAAVAALGFDWHAQIGLFVVLTAGLVGLAATRLGNRPQRSDLVNAPAAGLIGRTCRALDFRDGEGRVALGDGTWQARVTGGTPSRLTGGTQARPCRGGQPEAGQALKVVGLDGTTLLVAANDERHGSMQ